MVLVCSAATRSVSSGESFSSAVAASASAQSVMAGASWAHILSVGEASLADLNARLATPLPMNRFRPNLVVAGSAPWAEDGWGDITVGGIPMEVVKSCARCVVTTTDQATGRRAGDEPLRTLATFRRQDQKVMFGQNVVHDATGPLRVGDAVELEA